MDLDRLIESRKVLIVCGAGGVGKTTTAAAIGCRAAELGLRAAVLTVDPARRLASSLGFDSFEGEVQTVSLPPGRGAEGASFDAMMLDTRSIYDRLVERYATDREQVEAILENRFYRHFSGAVGGAHEYTAMERLYELVEEDRWDLLVLDTPPTVHALHFLDAPQRLIDAFDESIFRWVIRPYLVAGKVGAHVLSFGSAYIFKIIQRFTGGEMIEDLSEFLLLFQDMFGGFRERAATVRELLRADSTSFIIVAAPTPASLGDARIFLREMARMKLPLGGLIVNRAIPTLPKVFSREEISDILDDPDAGGDSEDDGFAARLSEAGRGYQSAAVRGGKYLEHFMSRVSFLPDVYMVPLFDGDVADVNSLLNFSPKLLNEENLS